MTNPWNPRDESATLQLLCDPDPDDVFDHGGITSIQILMSAADIAEYMKKHPIQWESLTP